MKLLSPTNAKVFANIFKDFTFFWVRVFIPAGGPSLKSTKEKYQTARHSA